MKVCKKLECLSLASHSSQAQCWWERLEPTQVEHLKDAPLSGKLLALPTDIRLSWKGLPGINSLAYYERKRFF